MLTSEALYKAASEYGAAEISRPALGTIKVVLLSTGECSHAPVQTENKRLTRLLAIGTREFNYNLILL
jgi:hypothetical protein